ncbi:hypothetical protein [Streptomyces sp. NPDC054975]
MDTLAAAAPRLAAFPPAACILHGDFHPMASECWGATVDWYFAHDHLDQMAARDAYQAAVERQMLDRHARENRRPQDVAAPPGITS